MRFRRIQLRKRLRLNFPETMPLAEGDERALELMREREEARAAKEFARADELRDRLAEMGWTVRDSADGPSLVPKT